MIIKFKLFENAFRHKQRLTDIEDKQLHKVVHHFLKFFNFFSFLKNNLTTNINCMGQIRVDHDIYYKTTAESKYVFLTIYSNQDSYPANEKTKKWVCVINDFSSYSPEFFKDKNNELEKINKFIKYIIPEGIINLHNVNAFLKKFSIENYKIFIDSEKFGL